MLATLVDDLVTALLDQLDDLIVGSSDTGKEERSALNESMDLKSFASDSFDKSAYLPS